MQYFNNIYFHYICLVFRHQTFLPISTPTFSAVDFFINSTEKFPLFNTVLIIFSTKRRIFIAIIQMITTATILKMSFQRRRGVDF